MEGMLKVCRVAMAAALLGPVGKRPLSLPLKFTR